MLPDDLLPAAHYFNFGVNSLFLVHSLYSSYKNSHSLGYRTNTYRNFYENFEFILDALFRITLL